jgi:hypothetical protein
VVTRAGVTRREFDEEFPNAEDCFLAAFDRGIELLGQMLSQAVGAEGRWLARVRLGLLGILRFLDAEPAWARLLVVHSAVVGTRTLERREQALARLGELMEQGTHPVRGDAHEVGPADSRERTPQPRLMTELVVGGVFSVIRARMIDAAGGSLTELAPSLMSMIVLPHLGRDAAIAELARTRAALRLGRERGGPDDPASRRNTRRSALVLRAIASQPRSSNREIAATAGLADEGQTSRLLRRLKERGLIENVGLGHAFGEPNAWVITQAGREAQNSSNALARRAPLPYAPAIRPSRASCQRGPR